MMPISSQHPDRPSRFLIWQREIADGLVLYSISILACAATFQSSLFDSFVKLSRAQEDLSAEKLAVISIFFGIASAVFGVRRLADQYTERKHRLAAEQNANSLSLRDPLTSLPNRRRLEHELGALREGGDDKPTILLIGLKRLGAINNMHGHVGADAVLSQVAARLRRTVEGIGFLARIGDDVFAVLISGQDADRATRVATALVDCTNQPVQIGMRQYLVGAHVGIAQENAENRMVADLLRRARVALDRAMAQDIDCCFFDPEMDAYIRTRSLLEQEFRSALRTDAIRLYYQPIVDLRSGKIVSFEALARWNHPDRGFISPESFIPLTEHMGLMASLSGQLFGDACRQALTWPEHVSLSFNFSASQLSDPSFGEAILQVLEETGFPPYRLEAEVTESAVITDFAIVREIVKTLASAGVTVVMDDFGTGCSSLRHVRDLRFNKLKIDRSFVTEISGNADCRAIVSAVAGLGRSLGIHTVAVGIETEDQLALVRAAGCTHGQGYLFARPRPISEIDFSPFVGLTQKRLAA